jgi:two-component system, chemotaxis family, protein-glutamate methylesterase/glutaminase
MVVSDQSSQRAPRPPVRVLIVDDSAVMRSLLRSVVSTDPRIEIAATASDGAAALRLLDSVAPDIVLLDVEMPVMDGLSTLKALKARNRRLPVIMCSALTQRGGKVTIEALASGASDCVCKPSGAPSREAAVRTLALDLVPKILALTASRALAGVPSSPIQSQATAAFAPHPVASNAPRTLFPQDLPPAAASPFPASNTPPSVLLIGVSTGGPAALDLLLPAMPATFPLPILIVQHMPELFTRLLAERLNERCPLAVSEAVHGQPVRPRNIYIARGNYHMEVTGSSVESPGFAPMLRLTQDPPENHCRPAVDVLFRSAVSLYGARILGVILTGMGSDGLIGSRLIRQHGGTIFAQDEATSAVWGMPGAVAQAGVAQRILSIQTIAAEILRLVGRGQHEASASPESTLRESTV